MILLLLLGFNIPPTAKVIQRQDLSLKSHPKDWRSLGTNPPPLVYKASSLNNIPLRLLRFCDYIWITFNTSPKIMLFEPIKIALLRQI